MSRGVLLLVASVAAFAQDGRPRAFEVAEVKINNNGPGPVSVSLVNRQARLINAPMRLMIAGAYSVNPDAVTGGPGWIDSDRFDRTRGREADGDLCTSGIEGRPQAEGIDAEQACGPTMPPRGWCAGAGSRCLRAHDDGRAGKGAAGHGSAIHHDAGGGLDGSERVVVEN
jgi:hypothetical protein